MIQSRNEGFYYPFAIIEKEADLRAANRACSEHVIERATVQDVFDRKSAETN